MSRRKRMMEDLDQDIRDYIERETQDNIEHGLAPEEARSAALRKFGNVARVKEDAWEVWSFVWLEQLWHDIRYGLRMLVKNPGFTAVVVLTLTLGIGANTAIFSVVNGVLLRPLPYADPDRLVTFWLSAPAKGLPEVDLTPALFAFYSAQSHSIRKMAAYTTGGFNLSVGGKSEYVTEADVTTDFFSVVGERPLYGHTFLREEDKPHAPRVAVLSYNLWQRRFGGDPAILGKAIRLDSTPATVVGIAPPGFAFPGHVDLWVPAQLDLERFNPWYLSTVGRLEPGMSTRDAERELAQLMDEFKRRHPDRSG